MHTCRHTRDTNVDQDGQERRKQGRERVVHTTVLVDLDDLVHQPADEVHPRESGGEGKTRDDGVQALGFQFLGNEVNSIEGLGGHVSHGVVFILYIQKIIYSGNNSSFSTIFLYFGLLTI